MLARSRIPTFRLHRTRGIATMEEVHRLAAFALGIIGQTVTIDGVTTARLNGTGRTMDAPPTPYGEAPKSTAMKTDAGTFTLPKLRGVARRAHLAAFAKFINAVIKQRDGVTFGKGVVQRSADADGVQKIKFSLE